MGWGGGRPRLLVLDAEIVDRAGDGSLWLAKAWERFLLPPDGVAEHWDACRSVCSPSPEADLADDPSEDEESEDEECPGKKSLSCASARLRSLRPRGDPLGRAAEASDLSSSTRRLGGTGTVPGSSPLTPSRASKSALRFFFCASASFPAASTGICSYCPKRPPPPPSRQSAPPGPSKIVRRVRQAAGGPGVAARSGGACCAAITSRTPGLGTETGSACTPCLMAARMLNLQKTPFGQETRCACGSPPFKRRIRRTQPVSLQNPQQGGWSVSECRWNAM